MNDDETIINGWLLLGPRDRRRQHCVSDTIAYTDERGKEVKLILVGGLRNSIFQGNILISEKSFLERFPSTSGSRVLLIDLPVDLPEKNVEQIAEKLQKASRGDLLPTLRKE